MTTLKAFMAHLAEIAKQAPEDAALSINGEPVETMTLSLQNPLAAFGERGPTSFGLDPVRPKVLDISINGREPKHAPIKHYPYPRPKN